MSWPRGAAISAPFLIFGRHQSFLSGHWYPCFGLLVMSALGFKAFASVLTHLPAMDSSNSAVVRHLLIGCSWQSSLIFLIHILAHVQPLVGLEPGIKCKCAAQCIIDSICVHLVCALCVHTRHMISVTYQWAHFIEDPPAYFLQQPVIFCCIPS